LNTDIICTHEKGFCCDLGRAFVFDHILFDHILVDIFIQGDIIALSIFRYAHWEKVNTEKSLYFVEDENHREKN